MNSNPEPLHMTVLMDADGHQVLYVDGQLNEDLTDGTIYPCDLIAVAGGKPFFLEQLEFDGILEDPSRRLSDHVS